jgi:hypothetical protein
MHLTQVDTTYCVLSFKSIAAYVFSHEGINCYSLLNKPIKKLSPGSRTSSVETKSKFIKIIIQVRQLNSSLMSAQQPPFEQGCNSVCQRQKVLAYVRFFSNDVMDIAQGLQLQISSPIVCSYNRTWFNALLDSRFQTLRRRVYYSPETDSSNPVAIFLSRNNHQGFTCCSATPFARPFPSNISFVHLYDSRKTVTPRSHHGMTKFVQPHPSCSVTAKAQDTLQPQSAYSLFLIRDVPNGSKPQLQRFSRILEYGSCCYRSLKMAFFAFVESLSNLPRSIIATTRATKSIRPTKVIKIVSAGLFGAKSFLKFHQSLRIIFHTRQYYILGLPESNA